MTSAERELQLRAIAAASERRNRPRALALLGGALLLAGLILLIYGMSEAAQARMTATQRARDAAQASAIVVQIKEIRQDPERRVDPTRYAPDRELLQKLADVQQSVELQNRPNLNPGRNRPLGQDSPFTARTITATFVEPDLRKAMEWVNGALRASPGLFVTGIELKPTPRGWSVQVDLARWEISQ